MKEVIAYKDKYRVLNSGDNVTSMQLLYGKVGG